MTQRAKTAFFPFPLTKGKNDTEPPNLLGFSTERTSHFRDAQHTLQPPLHLLDGDSCEVVPTAPLNVAPRLRHLTLGVQAGQLPKAKRTHSPNPNPQSRAENGGLDPSDHTRSRDQERSTYTLCGPFTSDLLPARADSSRAGAALSTNPRVPLAGADVPAAMAGGGSIPAARPAASAGDQEEVQSQTANPAPCLSAKRMD